MRCIDVEWIRDLEDEPFRLVSAIGDDHFETRQIELFRNGKIGFTSEESHTENARLGIVEVPSREEINSDKKFQGKSTSKQEF
ncbi:hypothetical protein A9Q99_19970 [Gammaproteobacteria bacterium 45_16_T64]|nr:hypothetical protein A9Q99_19970 [Gammaproteobacteria bacterium 45_16_T64]